MDDTTNFSPRDAQARRLRNADGAAARREPSSVAAPRVLPWLLLLFAGSGCAALIYEIVWYQLLEFAIGSTAVSLGVLLATFMGGLCIGSLALPRVLARRAAHPLRVYALIEVGIGVFGLLELVVIPLVVGIYVTGVAHGMPSYLLRALISSVALLPPTILMGASLPAIARWIETTPLGVAWMGLLYGANTAGAVTGCLLAGFYLLRVTDVTVATFVAAGLNGVVALSGFVLAWRTPASAAAAPVESARTAAPAERGRVYLAIALSGATALGAEVVWTRVLSLMLGATVYTFSIILAVFLAGLALGSWGGASMGRGRSAAIALGLCQLLLVAAIAWTAFMIAVSVPFWPVNPLLTPGPWFTFQIDLVRVIWSILPATLLWGASFPLALAAAAAPGEDPGGLVGRIYAANTAGAIAGAIAFSLVLIPAIGTQGSQRALILLAAAGAAVLLVPALWSAGSRAGWAGLGAALAAAGLLAAWVRPVPAELMAYGRGIMGALGRSQILYTGEGINSTIAISRAANGALQFHVSGKVEASSYPGDMRVQRMIGHLAGLFHPDPKSVLVVGFGAGVTAGSFVTYPSVQRIVICEIEPLIPPVSTRYFAAQNYGVMHDPRTRIYDDDARHFILTSPDRFDIITSDPIHPWVKGSAALYSKEYFELVKRHLNPGGVVTQWVPLYESNADVVRSEIATFFEVFPGASIWANEVNHVGYDVVLVGQVPPAPIDVDALEARLASPAYARVAKSLADVGMHSAVDLLATYAGQAPDLAPWLRGAEINRDASLHLQYRAGLALNTRQQDAIMREMVAYRRFPSNLLTGSPERLEQLRAAMQRQ
jgi:spermidine synthase